ncbi:hypothetical protein KA005_56925 [bacterium]|nr:hypothetical protein [bacterium]
MSRGLSHRIGKRRWLPFFCFCLFSYAVFVRGQVSKDTTQTVEIKQKSPTTAVIRSALIPGLGQLYNGQELKAAVVFLGELALVGNAVYLNQMAVQSKTELERVFYEDNRSKSLWWFFAVYILNLLDAYVDANLWGFDTGPDLSIWEEPNRRRTAVLTLSWRF